jgi:hypothetical protein
MYNFKRILLEEAAKSKFSGVEGYLQAIAQITSGKQKEYYEFLLESMSKVNVGSYRDSKVLTYHIDKLRSEYPRTDTFCQKKGCYDTAVNTSVMIRDIDINYVEGYVQAMIPILHAWNYYEPENIYFDLIHDIAWEGDSSFQEYYEILNFGRYELAASLNMTGYAGGFLQDQKFISSIMGW